MIEIEQFQVRGLSGAVHKVRFGSRTVDYWAPANPGHHVLVAHDGQNIFDKRNIGINPQTIDSNHRPRCSSARSLPIRHLPSHEWKWLWPEGDFCGPQSCVCC